MTETAKPENLKRFQTTTQQKVILEQEKRQRACGKWHRWTRRDMTEQQMSDQVGWLRDIHTIYSNGWCAVMVRDIEAPIGRVQHCTITSASHKELTWAELQRIKSDIFGPLSQAVQVYPRKDRLVETYKTVHLWVVSEWTIPFGLSAEDPAVAVRFRPVPMAPSDGRLELGAPAEIPFSDADNLAAPAPEVKAQ